MDTAKVAMLSQDASEITHSGGSSLAHGWDKGVTPRGLRIGGRSSPDHIIPFSERERGPTIPQQQCRHSDSKDGRTLWSSVNFYMQRPVDAGIWLRDVLRGRFTHLVARDEPMSQENGPSISIKRGKLSESILDDLLSCSC